MTECAWSTACAIADLVPARAEAISITGLVLHTAQPTSASTAVVAAFPPFTARDAYARAGVCLADLVVIAAGWTGVTTAVRTALTIRAVGHALATEFVSARLVAVATWPACPSTPV